MAPQFPPLKNDLLLRAAREFRELRKDHAFFDICRTPALATEITLQPIRRFTGLIDAAIIFSDILVIPQAMGMEVLMNPGPEFPDPLNTPADVSKLRTVVDVDKELGYVFEALTQTRIALAGEVPLIGFCGAPWTLFMYMIEGGGSKTHQKSKTWLYKYPEESKALLMRIADICVDYLVGQVKAGAQILQVFDSVAGELSPDDFDEFSFPSLVHISTNVRKRLAEENIPAVPMTLFAKGSNYALASLAENSGYDTLGLDWAIDPAEARRLVKGKVALQGNMDPSLLYGGRVAIEKAVKRMCARFAVEGNTQAWIANLGHGITPAVDPEDASQIREAQERLSISKPAVMFPATRAPPLAVPEISVRHRAEQGAHYLQTFLPDLEIPAELIRDELTNDANFQRDSQAFDAFAGNRLEVVGVEGPEVVSARNLHLAFPMGELGCDLNISPWTTDESQIFGPAAQIDNHSSFILSQCSKLRVQEFASISSAQIGGKPAVDVKHLPESNLLLVNRCGQVYHCNWDANTTIVDHILNDANPSDPFWRLELTDRSDACWLLCKENLRELDLRSRQSVLDIAFGETYTSVEDCTQDHLLRLCSTSHLTWFDRRKASQPVLAYKHHRSYDRTLEAKTITIGNKHYTTLSSKDNGLVTIYDVSNAGLISANDSPFCLSATVPGKQIGQIFLKSDSDVKFLRLSDLGAIHGWQITDKHPVELKVDWSEDVRRLHSESAALRDEPTRLGAHQPTLIDLSPAYEKIFYPKDEDELEESAEALYDMIEKAPTLSQEETNERDNGIRTTFDLLFQSGEKPAQVARSDFLTETVIDSERAYHALLQGRLSSSTLQGSSKWTHDHLETLRAFDHTYVADPHSFVDNLRQSDPISDSDRAASSLRRETRAREQLALDLSLARNIYSSRPFHTAEEADQELETMTAVMSLADEPAQFKFAFLRPVVHPEAVVTGKFGEEIVPSSVRSLLKDWDVGTDPKKHLFKDFDEELSVAGNAPLSHNPTKGRFRPTQDVKSHPPLIGLSQPVANRHKFLSQDRPMLQDLAVQRRPPLVSGSQPMEIDKDRSQSQEMMASTQILPGAFGGRPAIKKKVKKRIGGF
ncbi:unnamed protein product [Mycena citricolor]|uniref:Uroporphyrinogen decarboxylase n=1 Tax=Mycena citricolor TaxID=2018698 RepID=A0AAD2HJM1_9AGAR|nr:unnamed protein product [Mycena citricolor]CAK5276065.1 unnamed protein product [Mycena citricolor]